MKATTIRHGYRARARGGAQKRRRGARSRRAGVGSGRDGRKCRRAYSAAGIGMVPQRRVRSAGSA
jgi:hypothetical protein